MPIVSAHPVGRNLTVLAVALLSMLAACGSQPTKVAYPQARTGLPVCELRMDVTHETGGEKFEAIDEDGEVGVCIKRAGAELAVPINIRMRSNNLDRYLQTSGFLVFRRNWTPICIEGTETAEGQARMRACQWNFAYRSKFPMEFHIRTEYKVALREYLSAILVYQNGKLVAAWDRSSYASHFDVPHAALNGSLLPYDAPIDLQFVPARVAVDASKLRSELGSWRVNQLERVGQAAIETLKADFIGEDPVLAGMFECFAAQVSYLRDQVTAALEGNSLPNQPSPDAKCPVEALKPGSLVEKYERLKHEGVETARRLELELYEWLEKQDAQLAKAVSAAKDKLVSDLRTWRKAKQEELVTSKAKLPGLNGNEQQALLQKILQLENLIARADQALTRGLTIADEIRRTALQGRAVVLKISSEVKELGQSPARQARLFANFVGRLDDPFVPRQNNPTPDESAEVLRMVYREHFQTFWFAPWSGVPIRPSGPAVGVELEAGNLVPILDVFGMRWQWGASRFSELRFVPLGWMYFPDKIEATDAAGARTIVDAFNTGPQVNVSLANFRLGAVYVVNRDRQDDDRFRLVIGADLYKLISGENVELF